MEMLSRVLIWVAIAAFAYSHCQVPCGIFDDNDRFKQLKEDVTTIRKSISEISKLAENKDKTALEFNQLVRWINTKETHANHIIETISEYFLAQRIIEVPAGSCKDNSGAHECIHYHEYLAKLEANHRVIRLAMKSKQNVDQAIVDQLLHSLESAEELYSHNH